MQDQGERNFLAEKYIGSAYQKLVCLDSEESSRTMLVRHKASGRIAVLKSVSQEGLEIYRALRQVRHPNLPKVYEACQAEGEGIVIEEFISGETLESILEDGCLPEEKVVQYTAQLLDALQEIHAGNIIHRDITPSNVLISSDDVVKLIDFGISRSWKENRTKDTAILGTAGYASPEQFGFQQTDITADFFALGVLINVMLTGAFPNETLTEHKKLGKIVRKCIQMDPAKRYQSAGEIRRDLTGMNISGKRDEVKEDVSFIPGFRSNVLWRKVVGIAGYVLMVLYAIGSITQSKSDLTALLLEIISLLLFLLAFLSGSNFARWDRRLQVMRNLPQEIRMVIRIFLCICLVFCAFELDNFVRTMILDMPKSGGT